MPSKLVKIEDLYAEVRSGAVASPTAESPPAQSLTTLTPYESSLPPLQRHSTTFSNLISSFQVSQFSCHATSLLRIRRTWRVTPRSLSNNSFLETKNATQYPAYSNLDFVVELLTSLHLPNYAYRLEYCLSDRLLARATFGRQPNW